jgi:hypothetical protein
VSILRLHQIARKRGAPGTNKQTKRKLAPHVFLPRYCAKKIGAGEGNRTLVFSLEGCCSTIELHPLSSCVTGFGRPHRRMRGVLRGAEPIRQVRALSKPFPALAWFPPLVQLMSGTKATSRKKR